MEGEDRSHSSHATAAVICVILFTRFIRLEFERKIRRGQYATLFAFVNLTNLLCVTCGSSLSSICRKEAYLHKMGCISWPSANEPANDRSLLSLCSSLLNEISAANDADELP